MRFIHTADWHLGKYLHGYTLLQDQQYALQGLISLMEECGPDLLIIAGDVYDRSVPPAEAVDLFNWFLEETVLVRKIPVLAIAGNHDGPERLAFGSSFMARSGLRMIGPPQPGASPLLMRDSHGPVAIHPIPFVSPEAYRSALMESSAAQNQQEEASVRTHHQAMEEMIKLSLSAEPVPFLPQDDAVSNHPSRRICVAHAFVAGGSVSDSERPLTVGGSGTVAPELFAPFNYTALGHLHAPQKVLNENVRYSGSLLKYSVSEAVQSKEVLVVDLDEKGGISVTGRVLPKLRDLRIITGPFDDLLKGPIGKADDWVALRLEDRTALFEPMARLREVYPNIIHLERISSPELQTSSESSNQGREKISNRDLFRSFFDFVTGQEADDGVMEAFDNACAKVLDGSSELMMPSQPPEAEEAVQ